MRTRLSTYRWRPGQRPGPSGSAGRGSQSARSNNPGGNKIRSGHWGRARGRRWVPRPRPARRCPFRPPGRRAPARPSSEFPAWPLPGRAAAKLQAFLERFPVSSLEHLYIFFRRIYQRVSPSRFTSPALYPATRDGLARAVASRLLSARRYARSLRFSIPALYCPPLPST